jgi:hypothetical protein
MRKVLIGVALLCAIAIVATPATAKKRHSHKPSGVEGVVFNSTCAGPCAVPAPPEPVYSGAVTITVQRASDGQQVASQAITDGHFKLRVKRGFYDVSSVQPNPNPQACQPGQMCPMDKARSAAVVRPCLQGETKRVQVRHHHFTHVELHVSNVCIV